MKEAIQSPKTRVLVVDDDAAICLMLSLMLSNDKYQVETTESVSDALAVIEQNSFDVYVMDCSLQDGDGMDVAKRLRSKGSKAPILFISGYNPSTAELRAQKLYVSSFLQKPFSQKTFCNAVKTAIGSPLV